MFAQLTSTCLLRAFTRCLTETLSQWNTTLRQIYVYSEFRHNTHQICTHTYGKYILTLNELGQLMPDPLTSWWVWPTGQCVTPVPAHWRQHSESSPLRTSGLAGHVWTAVIITAVIVTDIEYQKRSYQHCLQHLHWQVTQRLQQQHRLDFTVGVILFTVRFWNINIITGQLVILVALILRTLIINNSSIILNAY